ncbi:MAG: hypothetical protein E6K49_06300 [Gammaproteobacteria bacterium]|nr:MAG: hypothetical protein E6K49_06300 [Gammaproteobacteria bacterium]
MAISNFILATFNLITNHNNVFFRLIQLISLAFIVFIILIIVKSLILRDNLYKFAFIIPLSTNTKFKTEINTRSMSMSINRITYLEDLIEYDVCIFNDCHFRILEFSDILEIKHFLNELMEDQIYVVILEFLYSSLTYSEDSPTIILSKPILITKNSNPDILSKFIHERINVCINTYYLNDSLFYTGNKNDRPAVKITFNEIKIF